MKRLMERFGAAVVAAAFAEEGDAETARALLREGERARRASRPAGLPPPRRSAAGGRR